MSTTWGRGFCTDYATDTDVLASLTVDTVRHSGALVVTALVDDRGQRFYDSRLFYGFDEDEARREFCQSVFDRGYRLVCPYYANDYGSSVTD